VLQVAARWSHGKVVHYLLSSVNWARQDIEEVLVMENISEHIKQELEAKKRDINMKTTRRFCFCFYF